MKITAELNLAGITVADDEKLIIVMPSQSFIPDDDDPDHDPLMQALTDFGLGDRVFILYAEGVQLAKVKQ